MYHAVSVTVSTARPLERTCSSRGKRREVGFPDVTDGQGWGRPETQSRSGVAQIQALSEGYRGTPWSKHTHMRPGDEISADADSPGIATTMGRTSTTPHGSSTGAPRGRVVVGRERSLR